TLTTQQRGRIGGLGSFAPSGILGSSSPFLSAASTLRSQSFLTAFAAATSLSYFACACLSPLAFSSSAAMTAAWTAFLAGVWLTLGSPTTIPQMMQGSFQPGQGVANRRPPTIPEAAVRNDSAT